MDAIISEQSHLYLQDLPRINTPQSVRGKWVLAMPECLVCLKEDATWSPEYGSSHEKNVVHKTRLDGSTSLGYPTLPLQITVRNDCWKSQGNSISFLLVGVLVKEILEYVRFIDTFMRANREIPNFDFGGPRSLLLYALPTYKKRMK
ncbi:hypothetical protein ACMFMG_007135 [Clarireedia jacksonii]